uniref:UEV domain-containing protein n=1 Tax=Steinernema glaseri TaxID=37863 RepID=A0A1I7ZBA3_9BILA
MEENVHGKASRTTSCPDLVSASSGRHARLSLVGSAAGRPMTRKDAASESDGDEAESNRRARPQLHFSGAFLEVEYHRVSASDSADWLVCNDDLASAKCAPRIERVEWSCNEEAVAEGDDIAMADASAVEANLRQARVRYLDSAKDDILAALRVFKDLSSTTEMFQFPGTPSAVLAFTLVGTIPIDYKGGRYHIPVALHLCNSHPYTGPFCYVRPTRDMKVKASRVVDQGGRIYLPYLSEWSFPGYDLSGLLQVMTITFQEQCPVFSNSSNRSSAATPTLSSTTPYPNASPVNMPVPYQPFTGSSTTTPYPSYQPPYPSYSNIPAPPTSQPSYPTTTGTGTIQPDHMKASLLSAIEHKFRMKLGDKFVVYEAELQSIMMNLNDLRSGQSKIKAIIEQLDRDRKIMNTNMLTYKEKKIELERNLQECVSDNAETDIDTVIDAVTPVHRQIVDAYCADCAIDDAIYALGQAVKDGTINVQLYLKLVRHLSRKQFVHRALIRKCRIKARLPV